MALPGTEAGTNALPVATFDHTSLVYNGKMWVIGGNTGSAVPKVYSSTDGITWTEAGTNALPVATQYHTSLVYNGKMWVIGGIINGSTNTRKVYSSTDGITWTEAGTNALPVATYAHTSLVYDGKIWVIGGINDSFARVRTVYYSLSTIKGGLVVTNQSSTELLRLTSGGNLGIATTSPVALLQAGTSPTPGLVVTAAGNVGIGNTNPIALLQAGTSPTPGFVVTAAGNVGIGNTLPVALLQAGTSPTPGLVVTVAGNVGIGTTAPTALLTIYKSVATATIANALSINTDPANPVLSANGIIFYNGVNAGGVTYNTARIYATFINTTYAGGRLTFQTPTGAGTFVDVMSLINGNVGIGTTTPVALLQAGSSPTPGLVVTAAGNVGIGNTNPIALLQAGTSPTPGLFVTAAGNVGIGNTSPATKLDVTGSATIRTGGSANKATCWKSDGITIGYCSSVVDVTGACTCN